jgi:hypothetical protein
MTGAGDSTAATRPGLTIVGDPSAEVCEGDACLLPAHLRTHTSS